MAAFSIESERITLRRMTEADLDWLARLHGDRRVMRYVDDGKAVPLWVVATQTLPAILREYAELPDGLGCLAAVERVTGRPLGWVSLRPPNSTGLRPQDNTGLCPQDSTAELGYRLLPDVWGRGLATEGARALVRSAFTDLGLDHVVATTMTVNLPSRRVLEKAGLSLIRTFLAAWPGYLEGAEHGDVVYAAASATWQA